MENLGWLGPVSNTSSLKRHYKKSRHKQRIHGKKMHINFIFYQTSQSTWPLRTLIGWNQINAYKSKITFLHQFQKNLCDIMRAAFKKAALKMAWDYGRDPVCKPPGTFCMPSCLHDISCLQGQNYCDSFMQICNI